MGIQAGTTITVTFDARQIAQLDSILQQAETFIYSEKTEKERYDIMRAQVNNVFRALHEAGYR